MDKNEITEKVEVGRRLVFISNCGSRLERAADAMARNGLSSKELEEAERCAVHALAHVKELRASLTPQEQ